MIAEYRVHLFIQSSSFTNIRPLSSRVINLINRLLCTVAVLVSSLAGRQINFTHHACLASESEECALRRHFGLDERQQP